MLIENLELKNTAGFTLIEAMIFMLIFAVVSLSFYRTMVGGLSVIRDARARIAATGVATEQFEVLRNLAYEDLGIDGSDAPIGKVKRDMPTRRSGIDFNVHTEIRYVDNDYDGVAEENEDTRPNDYKQVAVTVSWGSGKSVRMISHIAPPGTEELYNGGILSIEIRQTDGQLVTGARVKVRDIETNQIINDDVSTDGKAYLVGITPKNKKYEITVTKSGYYSVQTFPPYNLTDYDPVDEHGSVVLAGIWHQTIIFDQKVSVKLQTQDPAGNPIGNIEFALEGGRKLGDSIPDNLPVYSYLKANHQTDSAGRYTFSDQSAGKYIFYWSSSANNDNYEFWKVIPMFSLDKTVFWATAGQETDAAVLLLPKNTPSLFLTIEDEADHNPISEAKVTVKNETAGFSQEALTDQFGQVYFSSTVAPLVSGTDYTVTVQAEGYQDETPDPITVTNLTKQTISLQSN